MGRSHGLQNWMLLGAALVLAAGCNKPESEAAEELPPSEAPAAPATAPTLVSIDLGRSLQPDNRVVDETEEFGPNDTIHASVHTNGSAPNATLTARWMFEDGQVVDSTSQTVNLAGDVFTAFHISKPTAWPAGKYKVEILLNGVRLGDEEFEIKSRTDR